MTHFAIICSTKKFKVNLEVSEVLITYVTNRGRLGDAPIGAGHSNNCQIILKLFGYDIFCNNLQYKTISRKFGSFRFIKPFPVCVPVWVPGEKNDEKLEILF